MMELLVMILSAAGVVTMLYRIQEKLGGLVVKVDHLSSKMETVINEKDDHEARLTVIETRHHVEDSNRPGKEL